MNKRELELWLCAPQVPPPAPSAIAAGLGLPVQAIADTTLLRTAHHVRSLRFTLALLRDVFADDSDVRHWLIAPREALGGASPRAALLAGRTDLVEELAVATWNEASNEGSCVSAACGAARRTPSAAGAMPSRIRR